MIFSKNISQFKWIKFQSPQEYKLILDLMDEILLDVIDKKTPESIILLEHEPVITAGTSSKENEILAKSEIPIFKVGRGGKYTYHGPGQKVAYPILDLRNPPWNKDLKKYLNFLHIWIISSLSKIGIKSFTHKEHVGVWVNDKKNNISKIAAIGIRIKKWVVYHGIAININNNLDIYKNFIPCGIKDLGMTSVFDLGKQVQMDIFDKILIEEFYNIISTIE